MIVGFKSDKPDHGRGCLILSVLFHIEENVPVNWFKIDLAVLALAQESFWQSSSVATGMAGLRNVLCFINILCALSKLGQPRPRSCQPDRKFVLDR